MNNLRDIITPGVNWLEELPTYQRNSITGLLNQGKTPEEAAIIWLSANGAAHTYPFGSQTNTSAFYNKLILEVEALLCGEDRYVEERKQFLVQYKAGEVYMVSFLSTLVAPVVGAAAAFIAPAIALILVTVCKLGIHAWCSLRKDLAAAETQPPVG